MKMNKLIFPLMIALVATVAATGCKKGITKVTQLPGPTPQPTGDTGPGNTLPSTPPFTPGPDVTANSNGIPYPNNPWDPTKMNQDRSTYAAQTVHFAFDSAAIKADEESKVIIVSEGLKSDPSAYMLIEGHCDERGTEEYNRSLGERRALALREDLAKDGIDSARVQTISYGKDQPEDPGHDESAWSKNRRGVFVLCHPKPGM
jgi:peptidoglycan-associated lipoprotein